MSSSTPESSGPIGPGGASTTSSATSSTGPAGPTSASGVTPAEEFSTSSKISSLEDLRIKAPKVWHAMLLGIAMNMCNHMREQQEHLKKMMREGYQR